MNDAWLRPRAVDDLVERTADQRLLAGRDVAARFFDSSIAALRTAERTPTGGSTRVAETHEIDGLRSMCVKGFPVRWYYFVVGDRLDVVRLLADAADLGTVLPSSGI